jgi:ABC-2 type transport system permease protein
MPPAVAVGIARDRTRSRAPGANRVVLRLVARRAVRAGALWGTLFAVYTVAQVAAYTAGYPTQRARDELLAAYGHNAGLEALLGDASAIATPRGYAEWRLLGVLGVVGSVWGILLATRLTRGEEEAGRTELLLAGATTRNRASAQTLAGLAGGVVALFALSFVGALLAAGSPGMHIGVRSAAFFAAVLVAGPAVFLAAGFLTSQLATSRAAAGAVAGGVFTASYVIRMVADSGPALRWLRWASPIGWVELVRPLTAPDTAPLVPLVASVVVLAALGLGLAGRRDVGVGIVPGRGSRAPALGLLGHPLGLAFRTSRTAILGWLTAVSVLAFLIGSLAKSSTRDPSGSADIERALSRLGGTRSGVDLYLGLTFLAVALLVSAIAVGQAAATRGEEASGRVENLIARPVSAAAWLRQRLALAAVVVCCVATDAGLLAWLGTQTQGGGSSLPGLVLAGWNVAPPALLLLGVGALTFAVRPRSTSLVTYGYLAWSVLVEFLAAVARVNHWLLNTSVFFHVAPAPATTPDWRANGVVTALALVLMAVAVRRFGRRDIVQE